MYDPDYGLVRSAVRHTLTDLTSVVPAVANGRTGRYCMILSIGFALVGTAFLLAAFYIWVAQAVSIIAALGFTGLIILALAAAGWGFYESFSRRKQRELTAISRTWEEAVPALIDTAEHDLDQLVQNNPKTAILIAALAGFAAGR